MKSLLFKSVLALGLASSMAFAHFGVVLPQDSIVESKKDSKQNIKFEFTHPFMQTPMNLEIEEAGIYVNGKKQTLKLESKKQNNLSYFSANYSFKEPGIYQIFMIPKPYFEPSEEIYIKHITKTIINAYGYGEGWSEPLGLKAEIIPLTRPYGLYKGNLFSGVVLYKGKPAKNTIVEVEYYNKAGLKAPNEDFITQEVRTNEKGEFSFVMPLAGWWGFSALILDDEKITKDGKSYEVELGGVLWVETKEYK
ncbi:MAG: DUF4198 domain-containing protein [Helicobacter sp.]|nr:DUF4198 domain-containing protein [Helicobacter sp.]